MKMTSFKPIMMFASMVLIFLTACKKNDDDNSEKQSVPTLSTIGISDITQTTAVSGGNILDDGGSTIIERGVCWSLGHSPTIDDSKTSDGAGAGNFNSKMTNLMPKTTYFARAFATNISGTGYGMTMSFTTLDALLPTLVTTDVSEITTSSAISGGQITANGGIPIISRGVAWSTNPNPTLDDNFTVDGTGTGFFTSFLEELSFATKYYLRAYATNDAGTAYGNEVNFTTQTGLIELITTPVTDITINSAISGGNILDDGGDMVIARGIVWGKIENPSIDNNEGITNEEAGTGGYVSQLTELTMITVYYVRAYATNSLGTFYGNQIEFRTLGINGIPCPGSETIFDSDGNIYNTVLIGYQCWMASNLRTTKYNTGVDLPTGYNNSEWGSLMSGAYAIYPHTTIAGLNSDAEVLETYGALYNWYAISTGIICPKGWHVPSDNDWTQLTDYIVSQGYPNDSDDPNGAGNVLKSCRQINSPLGGECNTTVHPRWNSDITHSGFDEYDFSGIPGGLRSAAGIYDANGFQSLWWTSTENSLANAWYRGIFHYVGRIHLNDFSKASGFSVRCVRD